MNRGNEKIGKRAEELFAEEMSKKGFFPIFIKGGKSGQPCDFAVLGKDGAFLADVKNCVGGRFSFERIEPNQETAFRLASSLGVKCYFACLFEGRFRFLPWEEVEEASRSGKRGVAL